MQGDKILYQNASLFSLCSGFNDLPWAHVGSATPISWYFCPQNPKTPKPQNPMRLTAGNLIMNWFLIMSEYCSDWAIPYLFGDEPINNRGCACEEEKKAPRPGIEPGSPAWQAGILTTILTRISLSVFTPTSPIKCSHPHYFGSKFLTLHARWGRKRRTDEFSNRFTHSNT